MVLINKSVIHKVLLIMLMAMLMFIQSNVNADTPKPAILFQKMIQAYRTVDFEGRFTLIHRTPMGNQSFEIHEYRKAPDKRRIEVVSPSDFTGLGMVMSGEKSWRLESSEKKRFPFHFLPPDQLEDTQFHNLNLLLKNYKVRVFDGGSVADRDTYLIEITPKRPNRPSRKIWIDAEKGVPLKSELYDAQKVLRRLTAYSNINFGPTIDEKLFKNPRKFWDIKKRPRGPHGEEIWNQGQGKPDVAKIRDKAQFSVILFEQLPGGFSLQSINTIEFDKAKNVHLRYSDGLTVLSVFQSPFDRPPGPDRRPGGPPPDREKPREEPPPGPPPGGPEKDEKININGIECKVLSMGPITIFRWRKGSIYFTLISEATQKEMIGIATKFIRK